MVLNFGKASTSGDAKPIYWGRELAGLNSYLNSILKSLLAINWLNNRSRCLTCGDAILFEVQMLGRGQKKVENRGIKGMSNYWGVNWRSVTINPKGKTQI